MHAQRAKRSRPSARAEPSDAPVLVVASTGGKRWRQRMTAKARAAGFRVHEALEPLAGPVPLYCLCVSYLHEWDDAELDLAHQVGAVLVCPEFVDAYTPGLTMEALLAGRAIDEAVWGPRRLECGPEVELPVPQSVSELQLMPDRLQWGRDGISLALLNMTRTRNQAALMRDVQAWFRAFFATDAVVVHAAHVPPPPPLVANRQRYSYDTLLEQIWALKAQDAQCFAMIGLTDVDIFDHETNETIYGRATGDGGGVISSYHFRNAASIRCFLSTAVHETLHVFGMDHCAYFQCLMNQSCDAEREDTIHMFLCPCCLPKLQHCLGGHVDLHRRYGAMAECCKQLRLHEDAALARQLQSLL